MFFVLASVVAVALALYVERTGWLLVNGSQSRWALVNRVGHILFMATFVVACAARGFMGDEFAWFHWMVLAALVVKVTGQVGVRGTSPT